MAVWVHKRVDCQDTRGFIVFCWIFIRGFVLLAFWEGGTGLRARGMGMQLQLEPAIICNSFFSFHTPWIDGHHHANSITTQQTRGWRSEMPWSSSSWLERLVGTQSPPPRSTFPQHQEYRHIPQVVIVPSFNP